MQRSKKETRILLHRAEMADMGIPEELIDRLVSLDMNTQRLVVAQKAMTMHFSRKKQAEYIAGACSIPETEAYKVLKILRQLLALESTVEDRDEMRAELWAKSTFVAEAAVKDLDAKEDKTRANARGHLMKIMQFQADLYGLKIPTKKEIEFSQKRPNDYLDIQSTQIERAKELLKTKKLTEEATKAARERANRPSRHGSVIIDVDEDEDEASAD